MPRDLPDWGALSAQVTVHEVTDLGELAVRLGSVVTHDRRGDVVWYDDMESGIRKWIATVSGAGAEVAESTQFSRNGRTSVKLSAGSDLFKYASMAHYHPFPVLGLVGFEVSIYRASTIDFFRLTHSIVDGTALLKPAIRWVQSGTVLQYRDSGGSWVTITSAFEFPATATLFHTFKLVTDINNRVYVRLIVDDVEYSLADIDMQALASASAPDQLVEVNGYGRNGETDVIYVDDAIITVNEPAR